MTFDQVIRLIAALADLAGAVIWPIALVFVLVFFRKSLRVFLSNLGEFKLKGPGGWEASASRQVKLAALLGAAEAVSPAAENAPAAAVDPQRIADVVPGARAQLRLRGSRVLWVDDRPEGNVLEREALGLLDIEIGLSRSTEEALAAVRRRDYDLIISDMGRPQDQRAGYTLLDALRREGNRTPYVIYSSVRGPEATRQAREHGALGCTNSPQELFSMVTDALATRVS